MSTETEENFDERIGNVWPGKAEREQIATILRDNITFSGQVGDYVIHGAIDKILQWSESKNAELKKENERLREALRKMFKYMDDGVLIRDISKDDHPGWAIKMLPFVADIKAAHELVNPKQS